MAQWIGQYTGRTHETKVQVLEETLRSAIAICRASSGSEETSKAKSVRQIAERLLAARQKALHARLSALCEPGAKRTTADEVARLQTREHELEARGVADILREFHFDESVSD